MPRSGSFSSSLPFFTVLPRDSKTRRYTLVYGSVYMPFLRSREIALSPELFVDRSSFLWSLATTSTPTITYSKRASILPFPYLPLTCMHRGEDKVTVAAGTSEGVLLIGVTQEIASPKDLFPFGSFYISNVSLLETSELQIDKDLEPNFESIFVGVPSRSDV